MERYKASCVTTCNRECQFIIGIDLQLVLMYSHLVLELLPKKFSIQLTSTQRTFLNLFLLEPFPTNFKFLMIIENVKGWENGNYEEMEVGENSKMVKR